MKKKTYYNIDTAPLYIQLRSLRISLYDILYDDIPIFATKRFV